MAFKKGLGKGMMALVDENELDQIDGAMEIMVKISDVIPNRFQPRKEFDKEALRELSLSIKSKGVIQPIIITELGDGTYELVAGERRLKASKLAGFEKIPAIIRDFSEEDRFEIALIENIQREDLNALEVASAYSEMMKRLGYTQEQVAKIVGKSRTAVANTLRLLKLPEFVLEKLSTGEITEGHARVVASLKNIEKQINFTKYIIEKKLSVRASETEVKFYIIADGKDVSRETSEVESQKSKVESQKSKGKIDAIAEQFIQAIGAKVKINGDDDKGTIRIFYNSKDELQNIYDIVAGKGA